MPLSGVSEDCAPTLEKNGISGRKYLMEAIEATRCCMEFVLTCAQRVEAWLRISQSGELDSSGGAVFRPSWFPCRCVVTIATTSITQYLESEKVALSVVRVHCASLPVFRNTRVALQTGLRMLISFVVLGKPALYAQRVDGTSDFCESRVSRC